ncbi:MAG: RNA methyltransferase [Prevotella sp.]|nr:RNA methyltransferase [Prevotella sp.]
MISKNLMKLVRSLDQKKGRQKEGLFVAEGPKVVGDLLGKYTPYRLIATEEWFRQQTFGKRFDDVIATEDELRKISFLQHPQQVLGLFPLPSENLNVGNPEEELLLALDGVQDPGNLGTIIRIADWFGIHTIVCSNNTADTYNPKVVQATMGSIARVNVVYTDLPTYLSELSPMIPVYGTFLDGDNLYEQPLSNNGIIVMGNEGNGISEEVGRLINRRLLIPSYPEHQETAESLNVAIATAITCAEFRRHMSCNSV